VKRNLLVALVSVCLITVSAPKGLCMGVGEDHKAEDRATVQTDGSKAGDKKQTHPDKSQSAQKTKEDRRTDEMKWKLRGLGIASRVTIKLNNGNERYGSIERLDEDTFQIAEVDIKQVITVSYNDVKKVREGYGNPNQFTGKRWNPIWAKISVTALIVLFAVVVPLSIPRT